MTTFVLVHGAWSGASGFRHVRRLLQAAGHQVFTPSLTGIGERSHLASPMVGLSTHVRDVVNHVLYEDLRNIVLLGFSYGGFVVAGALEHVADRIDHLVFLDAYVPDNGDTMLGQIGHAGRAPAQLGTPWLIPPAERQFDEPDEAAWMAARRGPQPAGCFSEAVYLARPLEDFAFSRTYVKAARDPASDPRGQALWRAAERAKASNAWRYEEIDTTHMVASNRPGELAALLLDVAGGAAPNAARKVSPSATENHVMQNIPQTMKAMAVDAFGGADQLTLHTLPVPAVAAGEVVIRVAVAGVGVWDALEREGVLVFNEVRFPRVLGGECAGTVVAVGEGVDRVKVGDRVYAQAFMNAKGGCYAEYVAVSQKTVAPLPDGFDMAMGGGLPIAGATALSGLNALEVRDAATLMLWGASGGVGHLAIQLAKRMGVRVFAIASGADGVELARRLGADEAIDGHADDVAQRARAFAPEGFDGAQILVGGEAVQATLGLVRAGGIVTFPTGIQPEPVVPDGVALRKADGFANPALLDQLNRLVGGGGFGVHIAQTFALEDAAQAQEAMKRHYLGKIVLRVQGD